MKQTGIHVIVDPEFMARLVSLPDVQLMREFAECVEMTGEALLTLILQHKQEARAAQLPEVVH